MQVEFVLCPSGRCADFTGTIVDFHGHRGPVVPINVGVDFTGIREKVFGPAIIGRSVYDDIMRKEFLHVRQVPLVTRHLVVDDSIIGYEMIEPVLRFDPHVNEKIVVDLVIGGTVVEVDPEIGPAGGIADPVESDGIRFPYVK